MVDVLLVSSPATFSDIAPAAPAILIAMLEKTVTWDRNLLHTSDNFIKNNVKVKTALVIFTSCV